MGIQPQTLSQASRRAGGESAATEAGLSREAYGLLAQANLLRMRGLWHEAVEKCMSALKLAPDNASAQSLLGDIYENQGLLDDAIQWYRMALDVQPDSPADKIKLSRLLEAKARTLTPALPRKAIPEPPPAVERPTPTTEPAPRHDSARRTDADTLLKRVAYGAGALALLVILAAMALTRGAIGPAQQVNVAPVVVPSVTSSSSNTGSLPPITYPATPSDPAELALATAIRGVPSLAAQGIGVAGIEADPRAGRLSLTITCQPPPSTPLGRDLVLRDAVRALQAAIQVTDAQAYTAFTVRCLAAPPSGGGGSTPLLFVADASRSGVAAVPADIAPLSAGQVLSAFTNPWWSPSVPQ